MSGLKIDSGAWVLVCDGAKALVLRNTGTRKDPDLTTQNVYEHVDAKSRELGTDRPGRSFSSAGSRRSAVEQTDFHDQAEQKFLAGIAARLDKAALAGEIQSLIVVAPPRAIGMLRRAFTPHVRQVLKAEVEKDYVKMPIHEIARHLAA